MSVYSRRASAVRSFRAALAAAIAHAFGGSAAPTLGVAGRGAVVLGRRLCLALAGALAIGLLSTSAAYAYGVVGTFDQGNFNLGVAVDPSSGDVYVANFESGIEKYSASGSDLGAFGGCASEFCMSVAVDPVNGDVYEYDSSGPTIDVVDPTGALVTSFPVSGPAFVAVQIATDSAGNVYYPNQTADTVQEFSSSGTLLNTFSGTGSVGAFSAPQGVAVDSNGDLYVADTGNGRVVEIAGSSGASDPNGAQSVLDSGGSQNVAVDPATGDVFVLDLNGADSCGSEGSPCYHALAYHSDGTQFADFGAGTISNSNNINNKPNFLAVSGATGDVYISDNGNAEVFIYAGVPAVATGQATSLSGSGARLNGTVNPSGFQVSTCEFEYVDQADYNPSASDPYSAGATAACVPAAASIPPDSNDHAVTADITSLSADTTYHFRLDAANSKGTGDGTDQTFTTAAKPSIDAAYYSQTPGPTTIDLVARIDPNRADTTYHFEYGTTTSYGTTVPVPDADIGSGSSDATVIQFVTGLTPGATYHWRVVAVNSVGTTTGIDQTFTPGASSCPNAQLRTGYSASLPDCRAYELVSPPDKNGGQVGFAPGGFPTLGQASSDGDRAVYTSPTAFADAQSGPSEQFYLSARTASGWSTDALLPPQATNTVTSDINGPLFADFSADLLHGTLVDGGGSLTDLGQDSPPLVSGEPQGFINLFHWSLGDSFQLLTNVSPPNQAPVFYRPQFEGASADYSHVLFQANDALLPNAPANTENVYEWVDGTLQLVNILPNGQPDPNGSSAGEPQPTGGGSIRNALSADGLRAAFQDGSGGPIYVRVDGTSTVAASASQKTNGSGPGGSDPCGSGGTFDATMSTDGAYMFFESAAELTNDAYTGSCDQRNNLYRYDISTGALTDLTVDTQPSDPNGAQVDGIVGLSDDGSYVYYVAEGVLAAGASSGQENLYVSHDGATSFIATLSGRDYPDWESGNARVTPDGTHLAFESQAPLTGYDSTDVNTGAADTEVYLYDAGSGALSCVSCNPSGAPPTGSATIGGFETQSLEDVQENRYDPRNLSDDGARVFFTTADALVPQDVNGAQNVYEWERADTGGCQTPGTTGGCVALISTGQSPDDSVFEDASASGDDAFFLTYQQLVAQDGDTAADLYDARVGGGLATQNAQPPAPCRGAGCRGQTTQPPPAVTAASVTFTGPGNVTSPPPPAKVSVLTRVVHRSTFFVRVKVPAKGRITITGAGIKTVRKSVSKAGTYRLRVTLTAKETKALKRKLKLKLRVTYGPAGGTASSATVSLTVEPAVSRKHATRARRAALRNRGGVR